MATEFLAYLNPDSTAVTSEEERPAGTYAALVALNSPKTARIRPLVTDAKPALTASQTVDPAGYVIEAAQVRKVWSAIRAKSQAELDAEQQVTELAQLKAMVTALNTDIAAGITAAPTTAAQAFVEIQDLKRRALRTDRAIRWLIKQQA